MFSIYRRLNIFIHYLIGKIILSILSDFILIPQMGVNGIAISNIIMGTLGVILLFLTKNIKFSKYNKKDDGSFLKEWGKIGLFAGGQQNF